MLLLPSGNPHESQLHYIWRKSSRRVATTEGVVTAVHDSLGTYLDDIGAVQLLTAVEERELAQEIEKGLEAQERLDGGATATVSLNRSVRAGAAAKDRFIRANLRLVVSTARRYPLSGGLEFLDLIQEGNLGLERAVDKFDWRKGFKFSTYATFWIRQAIGRALSQKASLIHIPGERMDKLRATLRHADGEPNLTEEEVNLFQMAYPSSLDQQLRADGDATVGDVTPDRNPGPDVEASTVLTAESTHSLLSILPQRTQAMVAKRFGLEDGVGRSYAEIGTEYDLSAEAVRRTVKRAIEILRDRVEYLDWDINDLTAA